MSSPTATKRLSVLDTDGGSFQIPVSPDDSLYTVRTKMTNLRSFSNKPHPGRFRFFVAGRILELSQEHSKRAWDIIEANQTVVLTPTNYDTVVDEWRKRSIDHDSKPAASNKRPREDDKDFMEQILSPMSNNETNDEAETPDPIESFSAWASTMAMGSTEELPDESTFASIQTNEISTTPYVSPTLGMYEPELFDLGQNHREYIRPTLEMYEPELFDLGQKHSENMHVKIDKAHEKCIHLLKKAEEFINKPELHRFCPLPHRIEWNKEIAELTKQPEPEIIIGCLGGTGVGKSSLLKALLNEDNILPTSSSRGCTAAVVELKFNREFLKAQDQIVVYSGHIEFISLQDWKDELDLLIDDCCSDETKKVSCRIREESEDAAAAWSKIDSVYGPGTMASHKGCEKEVVYKILSENPRVVELLSCQDGECNVVEVTEGQVSPAESRTLLSIMKDPHQAADKKLARKKRKWADSFRKKINGYVYRRGNGKEPQTWPLIRKVVLRGPWDVLATGACLVDLPGVRDDNTARAKVAENYLQNCTKIWICAPIKRAVDDKTAKDLLGEEFKRRLLMDGNYGNVSFICTHSDDCEISEIMHDHEDVAKEKPGRWERMVSLKETVSILAKSDDEIEDEKEDIIARLKSIQEELKDRHQSGEGCDLQPDFHQSGEGCYPQPATNMPIDNASLPKLQEEEVSLQKQVSILEKYSSESLNDRDTKRKQCHNELKILSSGVRNEFSRRMLQADFRKGMEELTREAEEEGTETGTDRSPKRSSSVNNVLPDDFNLEVFCTASNEYLKLLGVKVGSDGAATCFSSPDETGIPAVMKSVRDATEKFRSDHAATFIKKAGNILGRIYLYASHCKVDSNSGKLYSKAFESEMATMIPAVEQVALDFGKRMQEIVQKDLEPHLRMAATRGDADSRVVVDEWFASARRSRQNPKNKGIHWATFGAAARRMGVYTSATSGLLSLNQEVCNPLEQEFCSPWRQVMVAELCNHVQSAKIQLLQHCKNRLGAISNAFGKIGMDSLSIQWIKASGEQGIEAVIDGAFRKILEVSTKKTRTLSRSNVDKLRQKLQPTYRAVANVDPGRGKASRQMHEMKAGGMSVLTLQEFDPMMTELHKEVVAFIQEITQLMVDTHVGVQTSLDQVCRLSWQDDRFKDPRVFVEVFDSRNALLPNLVRLCAAHDNAMDYMDISREDIERVVVNEPDGYKEAKQKLCNDRMISSLLMASSRDLCEQLVS